MAENNQDTNDEVIENTDEVELSPVEQEAVKYGWKPQDDYDGDATQWRSAETFMALKPFYERIESQGREIKKYKGAFQQVATDVANLRQTEYDRAIKTLRAERKNAFEDGDIERYHKLEEEIDDVKDQQRYAAQAVHQDDDVDAGDKAEFTEWQERNTWYQRDEDLKDWADARGIRLHKGGASPAEVLAKLEKEVKEKFPTKFTNPNRERASSVEAGNDRGASVRADKLDMSDEEKKIMTTLVKTGVMTEKDYIKEYKKIRGIK